MPISIGISGGSGSGKTTLSKFLANGLSDYPVKVIHMDKYYYSKRPITIAPFSKKEYEDFNDPVSINIDKVVEDFNHALQNESIVIIEGFLLFHFSQIRENIDYKIFVDCQSDERLIRRLRKFADGRYTNEEAIQEYLDLVRYRHDIYVEPTRWYADIIINGSGTTQKGSRMLLDWIINKVNCS